MVRATGLDLITVWLGPSLASGAHPRRIQMGSSPTPICKNNKSTPFGVLLLLVPVAGLEPARCRQRWILSPLRLPFHHTGIGALIV